MSIPPFLLSFLYKGFNFNLGGITISTAYWQVVAIIFLLFLLIVMFAQVRRHYIDWSFKGGLAGIFFGFLLALILEGFLIIGGKTALIHVLGWKNAPKPISTALEIGRGKLVDVLGVTSDIPSSRAEEGPSVEGVVKDLQGLSPSDISKFKKIVCEPVTH